MFPQLLVWYIVSPVQVSDVGGDHVSSTQSIGFAAIVTVAVFGREVPPGPVHVKV